MSYTLHCLKFPPETDILPDKLRHTAIKIQERSAVVLDTNSATSKPGITTN